MNNDALMPLDGNRITTQDVTIDPTQPLTLSVTNASGDISIAAADRDNIRVVADRIDHSSQNDDAGIEVEVKGNKVAIHPNWQISSTISEIARKVKHQLKEGFNSDEWDLKSMKFGMNAQFDIHVELPRHLVDGSSISIKTASGDVSIADASARVSAATANGDVAMTRIGGKTSAHSASGDVSFVDVTGSIEANTANGDITVTRGEAWTALRAVNGDISVDGLTMKNARFTTVSGDIRVRAVFNNAAPYTFDTVSGDIDLETTLPASGASLNYKAVSGDVDARGDWTRGSGKRTWQLAGGSEGPDIRVKAVSGDLTAKAISDTTVTLQHDTAAPVAEEPESDEGATEPMTGAADFDWDKAKGWVSQMTQKISQAIGDMDSTGQKTSPTPPTPPAPPAPGLAMPPRAPEPPHDETPTEPVPTPSSPEDTAPIPPSPAPAWTNSAPVTPQAPETPEAETNAQRRLRLLEAVQRGEMTVDQALAQLDGDGNDTGQ